MIWISAYELYSKPVFLSEELIVPRNYLRIIFFAMFGIYFVWEALNPLKNRRDRTISWDSENITIQIGRTTKTIRWGDLEAIREDQTSFNLYLRKRWRGIEILKEGLSEEFCDQIKYKLSIANK